MSNGKINDPQNILGGGFPPKQLQIMNKKKRDLQHFAFYLSLLSVSYFVLRKFNLKSKHPNLVQM